MSENMLLSHALRILSFPSTLHVASLNLPLPLSGFPMDSMKGQGGIQMLLTAEQEAQQIISSAKNLKITRLKKAKEEAEKDVATYRSHLESEYQKSIAETGGASGANVQRLEEETGAKIQNLKESASKVSEDITGMLIKHVTTVKV